jgi:hypothetical protein
LKLQATVIKMTAEIQTPEAPASLPTATGTTATVDQQRPLDASTEPAGASGVAKDIPALIEQPEVPKPWKYTLPEISLVDRHVDEPRKLRVAVIGAGLSGVIAGVLLPAKVPGIELTIFDKNADVVSKTHQYTSQNTS